jgi:predicted Fe-Mo cluster-binding NifX family protein
MKIAVPVNGKSIEADVCISFGRAPYFLIYDTETKEHTFLANSAQDSPGGAGIRAAQTIADCGAATLLTPRCGENAAQILKAARIGLYKTAGGSVQDNIRAFSEGRLSALLEIHPGFHGHGG